MRGLAGEPPSLRADLRERPLGSARPRVTDPAVAGPLWRSTAVNRALRAATVGVLLLSPVVLSACSAGQVTQTATQERDKTGAQAQVGNISLRQVQLLNPRSGSYEQGDDADLQVAIVNGGSEADTLVSVEGEGFGSAEIEGPSASASSSPATGSSSSSSTDEIEIPAGDAVHVGEDDYTITLTDLDEDLTTG